MAWVKIDDHFDEHPKLAAVGPLGWGYWLAGLSYCNRNLTDGFIPWAKARTLASFEMIEAPAQAPAQAESNDHDSTIWSLSRSSGMAGEDITADWMVRLMVKAGLWDEVPGGYQVHDYADFQPTKAQVLEEREKKREAGRAGGKASAQARGQAGAKPSAQAKSNPVPVPVPDPSSPSGEDTPKPPVRESSPKPQNYTDHFETFWTAYPSGHGVKKQAFEQWRKIPAGERQSVMDGLEAWKACDRWKRGYVKDAQRWLRDRQWQDDPPAAPDNSLTIHNGGNSTPNPNKRGGYTAGELYAMSRKENTG